MPLVEDNVVPNDGSYFGEPEEQAIDRQKEKAHTLQALPILEEILAHFDERLAYYDSVSSIPAIADKEKFHVTFLAHKLTYDFISTERDYIQELINTHHKPGD